MLMIKLKILLSPPLRQFEAKCDLPCNNPEDFLDYRNYW